MNFHRRSDLTPAAHAMLAQYDEVVRRLVGPDFPYPIRMREWELWRILIALESAQPEDRILDVGAFNTYLGAYLAQRFPLVTVSDLLSQRCLKSLLRRLHLAPRISRQRATVAPIHRRRPSAALLRGACESTRSARAIRRRARPTQIFPRIEAVAIE